MSDKFFIIDLFEDAPYVPTFWHVVIYLMSLTGLSAFVGDWDYENRTANDEVWGCPTAMDMFGSYQYANPFCGFAFIFWFIAAPVISYFGSPILSVYMAPFVLIGLFVPDLLYTKNAYRFSQIE